MSFEAAARNAIALTKKRKLPEIGADELLLGLLLEISRFGVACLGTVVLDLEELGVDWLEASPLDTSKVAYSQGAVELFDRAARIARTDASTSIHVEHALAAFADETAGLMGRLKREHQITSATWRAAVAHLRTDSTPTAVHHAGATANDYLTPEQAAETLNIHVQTVRAYVRSGKLPALRMAGERAIRIRRSDLETVLEPLIVTNAD